MKYLLFSFSVVFFSAFTKTQAEDSPNSKCKSLFFGEVRAVKQDPPCCRPSIRSFFLRLRKPCPVIENCPAPPASSPVRKTKNRKPDPYNLSIEEYRANYKKNFPKNEFAPLRTQSDFARMRFFAPDPDYCFECEFEKTNDDGVFDLLTTDGKAAPFVKFGWVSFSFKNTKHRLAVYKRVDFDFLFIPFRDLTNGESTYGGGRFLEFDLKTLTNRSIKIDFNKAYNPWCHYNSDLPCPVPPDCNEMSIPLPVGEKLYGV
jgi:uncharacterized protein